MFPYTKQALQRRGLEVCAVGRCSWWKFQSFAQQSSVPSTLQSCIFTQTCYISHLFTVVFPLLMRRGRFLTRLCAPLSFYLSVRETKGTFFSVFTASHHHCLHLAGACFYWHWILIGDARETLQEHFELSSLSHHFNSEIDDKYGGVNKEELRSVRTRRKCTCINAVFSQGHDIVKTDHTDAFCHSQGRFIIVRVFRCWCLRSTHRRPCQSFAMAFTPRSLRDKVALISTVCIYY